jgi:hypothetical protein
MASMFLIPYFSKNLRCLPKAACVTLRIAYLSGACAWAEERNREEEPSKITPS